MIPVTGKRMTRFAVALLITASLAACTGGDRTTSEGTQSKPAQLRWEVGDQHNLYGFIVLRADSAEGPYLRINQRLVPAIEDEQERRSYEYIDDSIEAGNTYFYRLEAVSKGGAKLLLGDAMKRSVD